MTKIIDFARQKGGNFPAKMFKKLIFPLSCAILSVKGGSALNILDLDTPQATEKHFAPQTDNEEPFFIPEYGCTFSGTPCYQLRLQSPVGCVQYVTAGAGILICNDRLYTVGEGDVFLLPEGSNQIYYSNPDNRFARQWLNFKGALAKALLTREITPGLSLCKVRIAGNLPLSSTAAPSIEVTRTCPPPIEEPITSHCLPSAAVNLK